MKGLNTNSTPDLSFKKRMQEEREDERFDRALKELRGEDEESNFDSLTDEDLKVDLDELFSE